jgi:hypothetical protein
VTAVVEAAPHAHVWHLVVVDFESGLAVEQFECGCGASWFR